ncbi:EamA domain-containing membrane protein RarD [Nitrospirillum amazonense]|uniref:EamA domain-containing membrane protein RarD n=2 Tax=Nitrospirillum amazonense TaxID=28077 RepID=A0A560EIK1_9PROT|nr:DMT family transporter [Nitrospirillum amazonense]TWB09194.1 EamA domain-containing membrane protein RarD [Nitrospirillum amazonense]
MDGTVGGGEAVAAGGMTARRATLIGASAILLWSTLALLTTLTGPIPPFEIEAVAFAVAGVLGIAWMAARGRSPWMALRQPPIAWLLGVGGLFGYHFLYFLALKSAPAAEANLINYLWPLLIVLFAGLLPGERLGRRPVLGALVGLAGTGLLVTGGRGIAIDPAYLPGFLAAAAAAVTWGAYSTLSRLLGAVPTDAVAFFCLATAALSALCHWGLEATVVPDAGQWALLALMGLGPVGAAFFVWDIGMKKGDIHTLGALSYATPLMSTLLLILAGRAQPSGVVAASCLLIIAGAVIASWKPRRA